MKHLPTLLLLLAVTLGFDTLSAQTPFVTTWKTDNPGTSGTNQITIPTDGAGYNYDVRWESVSGPAVIGTETGATGDLTITFPAAGTYRISITGDFPRIYFNDGGDKEKILTVERWGDIAWTSMEGAFYGAANLQVTATDAPDLSAVTTMFRMFEGASLLNNDFNHWDVSNVTNMGILFKDATVFNGNISSWDVSNVWNMGSMFQGALAFDGDLGGWDVSGTTNMWGMFAGASAFSGIGLENWDVSNVASMGSTFAGATRFNSAIGTWDVRGVTDMASMFIEASGFNGDISSWDVSNVTNMNHMFMLATAFNGDLRRWDVSGVTTMASMFAQATAFDQDLGGWDITGVTDMMSIFDRSGLSRANYDATLIGWAAQTVQTGVTLGALNMEYCATTERQSLIDNHGWVFTGDSPSAVCPVPGAFVTTWKTDNPGSSGANELIIPTTGSGYNYDVRWASLADPTVFGTLTGQTGDVTLTFPTPGTYEVSITGDFPRIYFNDGDDKEKILTVEQWGDIAWTSMESAFYGAVNLQVNATDAPDLSGVTSTAYMFALAGSLNSDFDHWDVSNVTTMELMFGNAWAFDGDLTGWDVSHVTDMGQLFLGARAFTGKGLPGWDVSGAEITWGMFTGASVFNADISGWDVSGVTNMNSMFDGAAAFNTDISGWDVSRVEYMGSMFRDAAVFNRDISGWDVGNVTSMEGMFEGASSFNADISGWDVSKVVYMRRMFRDATAFDRNLGGWDITSVIAMESMLDNTDLSGINYDATLTGWAAQAVQAGVSLGAAGLVYCAEAERQSLINDHGWVISGDATSFICVIRGAFITRWKTDNPGSSGVDEVTIPTVGAGYHYDVHWTSVADPSISGSLTGQTSDVTLSFPAPGTYWVYIKGDFPRIYFNDAGDKEKILSVEQWGDITWASMEHAFHGAANLEMNATDAPNLRNVTSTAFMFASASLLNSDLNHWDVSNVIDMTGMFMGGSAFNGDVSGWNVSNVTDMHGMFDNGTSFNGDLSGWDVSAVLDMANTFRNANVFDRDLGGWNITSVADMGGMLDNTGLSRANYDATLAAWAAQAVQSAVALGAVGLEYCASAERQSLIDDHGWVITGDGAASGCPLEITGITFADGSFTYDGTAKSLAISGTLPAGTSVSYTDNSRTDAGSQTVTATIAGGAAYHDLVLTATLTITPATITGITFADGSFVYDGTAQSLAISGTLPSGTSVGYADNSRTDVGSQTITATISGGTNYDDLMLTATLTITPATITGITFADGSFVYDGTAQSLAISGTLPSNTSVGYADNSRTDVGSQTVTATISGGTNYHDLVLTARLTITPATITGIMFADGSFVYDGTAQSLAIGGTLPSGTSVGYADNNRTDVGSQTVTATISGGTNYHDLVLTATLTITPATITGIMFPDGSFVYDGTVQSLAISGTLPSGTSVGYADNSRTDVGSQTVTATISGGTNYHDLVLMATLTVLPNTRTLTFDPLPEMTFGDGDHPLEASSNSGESAIFSSSDEGVAVITDGAIHIVGAGTTTITATLPENPVYINTPSVSRALKVHKAPQTITFPAVGAVRRDVGVIDLQATSSSGLTVEYVIDDPFVAEIVEGGLNILRLGTATVTASQPGNQNYSAAEPAHIVVHVEDPESDFPIRVHPAVSPNGDGINDFLIIEAIKDYPENRVTVFNRNGTIVYEAGGYDNGTVVFRGIGTGQHKVAAGTYFYIAEIKVDGRWEYDKGWFVLRY